MVIFSCWEDTGSSQCVWARESAYGCKKRKKEKNREIWDAPDGHEGSNDMATILINAMREGYSVAHVAGNSMTISELIDALREMADAYGDDAPVVVSNDNGYTYGSLDWESIDVRE